MISTSFKTKSHKKGKEDLERWLAQRLDPPIDFEIFEFNYDDDRRICMLIIPATEERPVHFQHQAYIRVASNTLKSEDFPGKEAKI